MANRLNASHQNPHTQINEQPPIRALGPFLELGWEYARDIILITDCMAGRIVDANPEAERGTGYTRAELIGMNQGLLFPQAERSLLQQIFQGSGAVPGAVEEFHIQCKDGRIVPVEVSASAPFDVNGRRLVIGLLRDISRIEEHQRRLAIKAWALQAYAGAAIALAHAHSSASLMQEICEAITRQSHFVLAWVGFAEDGPGKPVRVAGAAGPAIRYLDGVEVSWDENKPSGQGPTAIALRTGAVYVMEDAETDRAFAAWREGARLAGIRSSLTAPFVVEGGPRGALMVYAPHPSAFHLDEIQAFTHLAVEIGIGLHSRLQAERLEAEREEREKAQRELSEALASLVGAVTTAMEIRDPYTAGHQRRVADLAAAIAGELHWPEEQLEALRMAALVHDIGKIAIPAAILGKSTALSPAEWALIKQHPETGYTILKDVPFRWPVAEAVRQHHERLDGSGYPRGLKGGAILQGARILAVADIVDSIASGRPYRPAISLDAALHEIEQQSGTLLDAEVVKVCIALFREKGFALQPHKFT